jgi:hypothetical protein
MSPIWLCTVNMSREQNMHHFWSQVLRHTHPKSLMSSLSFIVVSPLFVLPNIKTRDQPVKTQTATDDTINGPTDRLYLWKEWNTHTVVDSSSTGVSPETRVTLELVRTYFHVPGKRQQVKTQNVTCGGPCAPRHLYVV